MRVFPEDFEQNTQRKMYDEIASKNNGPLTLVRGQRSQTCGKVFGTARTRREAQASGESVLRLHFRLECGRRGA